MKGAVSVVLGVGSIVFAILLVAFLGGLSSAWWEIRSERKAGKPVTRPGWELNDKRRTQRAHYGRFLGPLKAWWLDRTSTMPVCWCGRGPLSEFGAVGGIPAGIGCSAWEAGEPVAIAMHEDAGGYSRTPFAVQPDIEGEWAS